jgi:hypothetical protein
MRSRVRFPVLPWGFFLEGKDSHADHGLGSWVEFRFKAPPSTSYSYITIHLIGTTYLRLMGVPTSEVCYIQPGGETTKFIRDMWWHWGGILKKYPTIKILFLLYREHISSPLHCRTQYMVDTPCGQSIEIRNAQESGPHIVSVERLTAKQPARGVDHLHHLAPMLKTEKGYTCTSHMGLRGLI